MIETIVETYYKTISRINPIKCPVLHFVSVREGGKGGGGGGGVWSLISNCQITSNKQHYIGE